MFVSTQLNYASCFATFCIIVDSLVKRVNVEILKKARGLADIWAKKQKVRLDCQIIWYNSINF